MSMLSRSIRPTVRVVSSKFTTHSGIAATCCKHTLPDLPYDYGDLEPALSGEIMELHHSKHHQAYVNNLNQLEEQYATAVHSNDVNEQINLQPALKFHGGGHINHTLFWENLAPVKTGGGMPSTGPLREAINNHWGSLNEFKKTFNTNLAGIQGSGWSWLVKDQETKTLQILSLPDPVCGKYTPIIGIDAWEHAYYLQYQNRKADYFGAIWNVINWEIAEKRFKA